MTMRSKLVFVCAWLIACGGAQTQAIDQPPTTPAVDEPSEQSEVEQNEERTPTAAGTGRMAFTQCDADNRPTACTKEHRPICAEIDNGVRCITTPCDSTDQQNFSNACMACANPSVVGHWPVACESLGNDAR